MSSMTAAESTMRAKRVDSRARSCMIREMTGMLVTATAIPKTSTRAARLPAEPMNSLVPRAATKSQARRERQGQATEGDQPHCTHGVTLQQPAHFCTGGEHEEEQSELIDRAEAAAGRPA